MNVRVDLRQSVYLRRIYAVSVLPSKRFFTAHHFSCLPWNECEGLLMTICVLKKNMCNFSLCLTKQKILHCLSEVSVCVCVCACGLACMCVCACACMHEYVYIMCVCVCMFCLYVGVCLHWLVFQIFFFNISTWIYNLPFLLQVWINGGDIILLGLRDYQDTKADVILKYTADEARNLKAYGELPESGENGFSLFILDFIWLFCSSSEWERFSQWAGFHSDQ